ncbi:MAG: DUF3298 domain-containing protein [Pedobacter sp.]|nr:DUF3298 domain-containing protein [Pedobacter sp.]
MRNLIAYIFLLFTISACNSGKGTTKETNKKIALTDTLAYAYDSVKVYSKNIPKANLNLIDTAKASISFPVFKNTTLNQLIKRKVFDFFAEEEQVTSYQDIADSFIKGYDGFISENPETPQSWFLIIKISVLHQTSNYLALKYIHSDYAGGAHGNTNISFLNYNTKTNTMLTLDSLIQKGKMEALVNTAEVIFRKNEKISPIEPLEGKYFFDRGKFALAQSFHVSDKGLVFLYNPYEIKAYAEGYTELTVPFSALIEIAKPNTILTTTSL